MNLTGFDADAFGEALRVDGAGTMSLGNRWILSRLQKAAAEVDVALEQYRFNDAAADALSLPCGAELCDWYIELAKPALYDHTEVEAAMKRRRAAQGCLALALETAMRLTPSVHAVCHRGDLAAAAREQSGTPQSIMITMYPVGPTGNRSSTSRPKRRWKLCKRHQRHPQFAVGIQRPPQPAGRGHAPGQARSAGAGRRRGVAGQAHGSRLGAAPPGAR